MAIIDPLTINQKLIEAGAEVLPIFQYVSPDRIKPELRYTSRLDYGCLIIGQGPDTNASLHPHTVAVPSTVSNGAVTSPIAFPPGYHRVYAGFSNYTVLQIPDELREMGMAQALRVYDGLRLDIMILSQVGLGIVKIAGTLEEMDAYFIQQP